MKNFLRPLTFILALGFFAQAQAQTLSLSQALQESEQNNPDLKKMKASAERQSWKKTEALSTYIPHVRAAYTHYLASDYMRQNIVFGGSVVNFPAAYPQDDIAIEASWTLFDGFEGVNRYRAASLNSEAADLDYNRAQLKTEETVRLAFFRALAAQKLLEVANQNVKTLEDHLSRAKLTEHAGYGTRFDVLRIQASLEEAKADRELTENNVQISRDMLAEAMGAEKMDERPLTGELPILKSTDVPRDLDIASAERADLQAQLKRDEASEKELYATRGSWSPAISLFAEQDFYKFGSFDDSIMPDAKFQNASSVGLRLTWNLFDGGSLYARQKQALQASLEAKAETQKIKSQLPRDFDVWKRKFFYSVSVYNARVRTLEQFQESVRLAGLGVKTGSRTHTEMLDAELDLFRARGNVVRAQAETLEALGNLELALGRKIKNNF